MYVTHGQSAELPLTVLAATAAAAGADLVQVREPQLDDRALVRLVQDVMEAVAPWGARVLVNDRFDVALAAGAGGVHLRSGGLDPVQVRQAARGAGATLHVGVAAHDDRELARAARAGCDHVTIGPLHAASGRAPLGWAGLSAVLEKARLEADRPIPWLALGGISAEDVEGLRALALPDEAWGLAAIRLFQAGSGIQVLSSRIRRVRSLLDGHHDGGGLRSHP